jgi:hypothetical protein
MQAANVISSQIIRASFTRANREDAAMCSTISGINCALWHHLGLPVGFWDISLHTVPEVWPSE